MLNRRSGLFRRSSGRTNRRDRVPRDESSGSMFLGHDDVVRRSVGKLNASVVALSRQVPNLEVEMTDERLVVTPDPAAEIGSDVLRFGVTVENGASKPVGVRHNRSVAYP